MKMFHVKYKIQALLYALLVILRIPVTVCHNDKDTDNDDDDDDVYDDEEQGTRAAIELIRKNDFMNTFTVLRDYTTIISELPPGSNLIYLCPAETEIQKELVQYSYLKDCWFIKEASAAPLNAVWCENEKKDQTMIAANYFFRYCGENKRGIRYMFALQVCWETNSWFYQYVVNIVSSPKSRRIRSSTMEIYTVCLSAQQPIYVKYTLNVRVGFFKDHSRSFNHKTANEMGELSIPTHNFQQEIDLYHIPTEHVATIYQYAVVDNDRLVPQFLFPLRHTKQDVATIAIHKYTNVNPIWESLKSKWDRLDEEIAKFGKAHQHYHNFVVYAGTYGVVRNKNNKIMILAIPKDHDHADNSENPTKPNHRTTLKVPLIWWKLVWSVTTSKGIIFAMYNIRQGEDAQPDKKLCASICKDHGWLDINEPDDNSVYCCEYTAELKEKLELGQETISIDGILDRNPGHPPKTEQSVAGKLFQTWSKFRPW